MGNKVMTIAEVDPDSVGAVGYRCNNDTEMYSLYASCTECVDALGLKATYYGKEAGGKTLALYDTDPGMTDAYSYPLSCTFNYKYIWLDDWYVYGSEADGRIATVDPKEVIAVNGSRMTGSEFPHPLNEYNSSPPPSNLLPAAMKKTNISGVTGTYQTQQRTPDFRRYEIKDHLGNVRTVIADYKNPENTVPPITAWKYLADVKNISNMYPYGKSYGTNAIYNTADDYRYGFNGMEKDKNISSDGSLMDFNARFLDTELPMFGKRDPAELEFAEFSPYVFVVNNPINAIDPDGKRTYFVGGAGNDTDGWDYVKRFKKIWEEEGIKEFSRVNASEGSTNDIYFTSRFRNNTELEYTQTHNEGTTLRFKVTHKMIDKAYNDIMKDVSDNPIKEGDQFNLSGYSYGAVLISHTALKIAENTKIDNLILIATPTSLDSELMNELQNNENIGNVIIMDIEGDLLSTPESGIEYFLGGIQNLLDSGPHFDLARPGQEADSKIRDTAKELKKEGVK